MYYFVNFYVSLTPLWISIIFKLAYKYCELNGLSIRWEVLKEYILYIVFAIIVLALLLVFSIVLYWSLKTENKTESNYGYIESCRLKKSFTMEYMFVYVLPLFAFNFASIDGIILFLIYFISLSILVCKYRYFMGNIICEIIGYKYYECQIKTDILCDSYLEKIVISRKEILKGEDISIYNINNEVSLNITHN